ncbi:TetR/AcrR family transcriptional regulator [Amycolatopsis sp. CA-230715]|uniref:TetR/AcrR family transcriptional regulator n=1 Tax=Amycolatopsis sp. CA-230715 TaxID=2745196 RepID=UPI001C0275A9|nr:TetR/AcrR family transcriptional regulator [Amycolatopsis sp. CA-230715]QWF79967.1 putative HTH-type transcriptional regulator [Amycolatopsis sp. CA-230715]
MPASRTARERARAELTEEIKSAARRQLGEAGADGLSLRAVARELGMVSSALYRYFASRDQLLTALIIDAYDAIGATAEDADAPDGEPRARWVAIWHATRAWALAHPHEYALIYGSPIPGYQAPQDTVASAARVAVALLRVVEAATPRAVIDEPAPPKELVGQLKAVAQQVGSELDLAVLARFLVAWTQLFGAISFELFGQYVGSADPADSFFAYTSEQMAAYVGL